VRIHIIINGILTRQVTPHLKRYGRSKVNKSSLCQPDALVFRLPIGKLHRIKKPDDFLPPGGLLKFLIIASQTILKLEVCQHPMHIDICILIHYNLQWILKGIITVGFTYRQKKLRIFGAGYLSAGRTVYDKKNNL